ncbi:heme-binding domain-containing protein [Flagellimonas pacifica]|uniref:Haem-binding domain-containing protein n=1 Tax=Flagellimonas pacifica TaxID=1247520 RepID=A0A285MV78_9FLAO|nr:heme-binding domain-containing protein [Allomuricauda parva]SNZ00603.1 Haem-binding domain-containing protein [Allomuricauda parva]
MKIVKKAAIILLIVLIGMQFYRPEKNEADLETYVSTFEAETKPSEDLKMLLKSACYDCHSANTRYPWYNKIAPVSYWLHDHIEEGREHLDFSSWESYSDKKKDHKLEELIEEVGEGEMPLNSYTWTHQDARLTKDQKKLLMDWAKETRSNYQLAEQQD